MKTHVTILLLLLINGFSSFSQISETIHLSAAGTLKDYAFTSPATNITKLTISGNIDARDVQFMRDSMNMLAHLDMENATIAAYTGTEGTSQGMNSHYPANEMPQFSFCKLYHGDTIITTIVFPQNITSIGAFAFHGCSNLAGTLDFPSTLTIIKDCAFWKCSKLSHLNLPLKLTTIARDAFADCTNLGHVILPADLTSIGSGAFYKCTNLTSINLPAGLISIGNGAFKYCNQLMEITNWHPVPLSINDNVFAGVPSNCTLKVSTASIPLYQNANVWKNFLHITGNGISISVLRNNTLLGTIDGLENRFYSMGDTVRFTAVPFPDVDFINWTEKETEVSTSPFIEVVLSQDTVLTANFERAVFLHTPTAGTLQDSLHNVSTISHLTLIGNINARDIRFMRDSLSALTYLDLSKTTIVEYTGRDGTWQPSYDTNMFYLANEMPMYSFREKMSLTTIVFPENLISIGGYAFSNCKGLKGRLNLPAGLKSIEYYAFDGCNGLIGTLDLPQELVYIGEWAFAGCNGFVGTLVLPDSLSTFKWGAFTRCYGFTSIVFPKNSTWISGHVFEYCYGLTDTLNLPKNLTYINENAFYACNNLLIIVLPENLTGIANSVFAHCNQLKEIVNHNPVPINIEASVFSGVDKKACTLIVPDESIELYKAAPVWKDFFADDSVNSIKIYNTDNQLFVYPNPTTGQLTIDNGQLTIKNIEIIDIMGKKHPFSKAPSPLERAGGEAEIDISHLPAGMYFLRIETEKGSITKKIIKQ